MKLSPLILLAGACLCLALFAAYERHQGAMGVQAQQRADSLQKASDSLKLAVAGHDSIFALRIATVNASASQANHRLGALSRHSDSLESTLRASTSPTVNRDTALQVIAAKDSALQAAQAVIAQRDSAIWLLNRQLVFYRDTVVVSLTKARDAAQTQLQAALKASRTRVHFPCVGAGLAGTSRGVGLGLSVGICYSL